MEGGDGSTGTTQRKKKSRGLKDSIEVETKENKTKLQQPPQNDGKTFAFLGLVGNSMGQIYFPCEMSGDATRGQSVAGIVGLTTGQITANAEPSHRGQTLHLGPRQPRLPRARMAEAGQPARRCDETHVVCCWAARYRFS